MEIDSTKNSCFSVPTSDFKSGEIAYKMETATYKLNLNTCKWKQRLEYPKTEGKTPDDYPSVFGTDDERVYKVKHYCCHNENDDEYTEHTKEIYANTSNNITDSHSIGEDNVCTHCGAYCGAPEFLSEDTKLKNGKVGQEYFATVNLSERSTNNGPNGSYYPEYTISENLPKGIYVDGYGKQIMINGMPKEAGTFTFTVKVTNNYGSTEKTFTLNIKGIDKLEIYTEKLGTATVGESCWLDLTANISGATWSVTEDSALPDGLEINEYGSIRGTPTTAGKYTFTVKAEAYGQTVTKEFTLIVLPEGGCTHSGKEKIDEVAPTCQKNGTLAYWYCKDCDCMFKEETCENKIYDFPESIETVSNHIDSNSDGKCDFCEKSMPLFMQVTSKSLITTEGTYVFVSKIDDKYYVLALPEDNGTEYTGKTMMPVCEVTPNTNGAFTFNELKDKNAIMVKTGFCTIDGNLDAGEPRYSLSTIIGKSAYGLNGNNSTNPVFDLTSYTDSKYGWHLSLDTNNNVQIGSVYHKVWSEDNTNEMLKAYYSTDESKYYMSLYDTTKNTAYDVQLYKMTDVVNMDNMNYILTDNQGGFLNEVEFVGDNASLSNVSGLSNAVSEEYIAQVINENAGTTDTSFAVESYVDIQLNKAELLYEGTYDSIKYSLTPYIKITDGNGTAIKDNVKIPDGKLNGKKMTVTLSIGENYEMAQIIHYKDDGTKEYFYSQHSNEVAYKGAKSFEFSYGNYGNFVTFELTSFSEIEILSSVKIEDDEDDSETANTNSVTYENKNLKITVEKAGTYSVIFANYSGNQMTKIKEVPTVLNAGTNDVKIPDGFTLSAGSKVFLWNTLSDFKPLCKELTIE